MFCLDISPQHATCGGGRAAKVGLMFSPTNIQIVRCDASITSPSTRETKNKVEHDGIAMELIKIGMCSLERKAKVKATVRRPINRSEEYWQQEISGSSGNVITHILRRMRGTSYKGDSSDIKTSNSDISKTEGDLATQQLL